MEDGARAARFTVHGAQLGFYLYFVSDFQCIA
jgi:hypothetical protein